MENMRNEMRALFVEGDLSAVLRGRSEKARAAAAAVASSKILARSLDELAASLTDEHRIEPVILDRARLTASQDEARVDVSHNILYAVSDRNEPAYVSGTRISFHVPLTGEPDLFKFQPSTFTTAPPYGLVQDHELIVSKTFTGTVDAEQVRRGLEEDLEKVEKYLAWANSDIEAFNADLERTVRQSLEARLAKVKADKELVAALGVPLRRRDDAPSTFLAPEVRRKPTIRRVAGPGAKVTKPEPAMSAEDYEHVLGVVQNMVLVVERSPGAFSSMGEEDLRQHFLVQLNGQYEGQATRETFNFEGKTDILVRVDGRNVFIAECKFWSGPEQLRKTVDQLLGYTSWRDTKAAIFIFNRDRKLSTVLSRVPEAIAQHASFVREIDYGGETAFRFVLHHRDDADRELTLTVLIFEIPA